MEARILIVALHRPYARSSEHMNTKTGRAGASCSTSRRTASCFMPTGS
jgi:hypothetical protein